VLPEGFAEFVVGQQEDVAFLDAQRAEARQTGIDQGAADSVASAIGGDGEMVEIAAAAVVAGKNGPDDSPFSPHNKAEPRIAIQVADDAFARVGVVVQADPFDALPKSHDFVVIGSGHRRNMTARWCHRR
jgi:hypothetical protein